MRRGETKLRSLFCPILLVVALCAFAPTLAGLLYGQSLVTALAFGVFFLASFALVMISRMSSLEAQPAIEGQEIPRQLGLAGWSLISYCAITGLGWNWACVFLSFARQYAFFSAPVIAVTVLIMAFYAGIAILVGLLTGGNWRKALGAFLFAAVVPAVIVLRLGLLR